MDEKQAVKAILFTSYTTHASILIESMLASGHKPSEVIFSYGKYERLSWRERIKNFLRYGNFHEPRTLLNKSEIPYRFVIDHNSNDVKDTLKACNVDLLLLHGTKLIAKEVLEIPNIGTLNAHSSLLPKYRGTKVEFWILYNNEPEFAGVTIHWVTPGLDEGDIFLQEQLPVSKSDTPESLREKSIPLAGKLFVQAVRSIENGEIIRIPQNPKLATKVKRPTKEILRKYHERKYD